MPFIDDAKKKVGDVAEKVKDKGVATGDKSESDVTSDPHLAGSRAPEGGGGKDGSYVGRESPDIESDVEQSGAEARSEQIRRSK